MAGAYHELLRRSFALAQQARQRGDHPFGALLADPQGKVLLEAENTVNTDRDPTAHAETNLLRRAASEYDSGFLADCVLYASTEPCPMCAGAIYWSNVCTVVYGLSQESLIGLVAGKAEQSLNLSCREVFARSKKKIEVMGPLLEEEARQPHLGFW
jgi:tRNA(Arg) A34 adenosine deaminase TadA